MTEKVIKKWIEILEKFLETATPALAKIISKLLAVLYELLIELEWAGVLNGLMELERRSRGSRRYPGTEILCDLYMLAFFAFLFAFWWWYTYKYEIKIRRRPPKINGYRDEWDDRAFNEIVWDNWRAWHKYKAKTAYTTMAWDFLGLLKKAFIRVWWGPGPNY